jgi:ABC-type glycerol-3-phosphate transport system substrate-binding protein
MLGMLSLLAILAGGIAACGGGGSYGGGGGTTTTTHPGTTPGDYTVTITGTSGSTTATCSIALTVN